MLHTVSLNEIDFSLHVDQNEDDMFPFDFPAIHVTSIPRRAKTTPPITESGKTHTDTYRRLTELLSVKLASACVRQETIMWMVVPVLSAGTWRSSRKPAYVTQRDGPNKTARSALT